MRVSHPSRVELNVGLEVRRANDSRVIDFDSLSHTLFLSNFSLLDAKSFVKILDGNL